jgi:hypothetical protein
MSTCRENWASICVRPSTRRVMMSAMVAHGVRTFVMSWMEGYLERQLQREGLYPMMNSMKRMMKMTISTGVNMRIAKLHLIMAISLVSR